MNAVEIVMQMFGAMSVEEKRQVIVELGKDADVQAMQTEVAQTPPSGGGGAVSVGADRSGSRPQPVWMRPRRVCSA